MKAISWIQKIDYFWAKSLSFWWQTEPENIVTNLLQAHSASYPAMETKKTPLIL